MMEGALPLFPLYMPRVTRSQSKLRRSKNGEVDKDESG